jgi:kinesin family protein 3/17
VQVATHKSSFDVVLGAESSQDDAYGVVADAIGDVATGVNVCVVAYGQTGSGKTYTMLGRGYDDEAADTHEGGLEPEDEWGIIPRAVNHLFALLSALEAEAEETRAASVSSAAASSPARSPAGKRAAKAAAEAAEESRTVATVACSYLQLYNEQVLDLLQNGRDVRPLSIHERKRGRTKEVFVRGLSEVRVTDASDVMRLLRVGARNRVVRATEFNEASSRSHAVLQLAVEVEMPSRRGSTVIRRAKLTMVDLAGSEKWTESTKTGTRRVREMTSINKSLSALGNVVAALTTAGRSHIPYRDSKLTRLLQDSIGGNCRTAIIATISPTAASAEESTSTLLFADR